MSRLQPGTTLAEVLVALVLVSIGGAWTLHATAAAQRSLGHSFRTIAALNRASLALAQLHSLPCDSVTVARTTAEPRWIISARRTRTSHTYDDAVELRTRLGDTIRAARQGWCD